MINPSDLEPTINRETLAFVPALSFVRDRDKNTLKIIYNLGEKDREAMVNAETYTAIREQIFQQLVSDEGLSVCIINIHENQKEETPVVFKYLYDHQNDLMPILRICEPYGEKRQIGYVEATSVKGSKAGIAIKGYGTDIPSRVEDPYGHNKEMETRYGNKDIIKIATMCFLLALDHAHIDELSGFATDSNVASIKSRPDKIEFAGLQFETTQHPQNDTHNRILLITTIGKSLNNP